MNPWKRFGWPLAGFAFVAGFSVLMSWRSAAPEPELASPDDQSLDMVAMAPAPTAPASALVPPQLPDRAAPDGWDEDARSGTTYRPAIQAVPRNLKVMPPAGPADRSVVPPEPKTPAARNGHGPMAQLLASTVTHGLVGAMVKSLAGGT